MRTLSRGKAKRHLLFGRGRGGFVSKCVGGKAGLYTEKNNAIPLWRDPSGAKNYDAANVLAALALSETLLIARLSLAVTIHHLAHGGGASAGDVATSPKPVAPYSIFLSMTPSEAAIAQVRRGATARSAAGRNRLRAVRASKVIDSLRRLKARNPYYTDVSIDQSRLFGIPEGTRYMGSMIWRMEGAL